MTRPILFSAPMVQAILEGRKTQTRRIVKMVDLKRNPDDDPWYKSKIWSWRVPSGMWTDHTEASLLSKCPYGQPGDTLWVRETWKYGGFDENGIPLIQYRNPYPGHPAGLYMTPNTEEWACRVNDIWEVLSEHKNYAIDGKAADRKWRPSIFMPQWASRITLEIVSIRVERLQDISEHDCILEGAVHPLHSATEAYKEEYKRLWESINGAGSWDKNPWVWVIGFR